MYDQCLNIYIETDNITIKGKYCSGGLAIPLRDLIKMEANSPTTLISTCLPDACLPSDFFGKYGRNGNCKTKDQNKSIDVGDIAFLIFLSVVLLAMVASTTYDTHLQNRSRVPQHKILSAFSVYTNGKKITKVNHRGQIPFFNGMKVISMFWVILGHRFESYTFVAVNQAEFKEWQTRWEASYVLLYRLSVDTFFFVSAALLSHSFLKLQRNSNKNYKIFSLYAHRYLRLTPALAALYFFYVTLMRKIVSGPYAPEQMVLNPLNELCVDKWLSIFFYIQNYASSNRMCLEITWYIDVDMQFIILSPLVLIPLLKYPKQMTYIVLPNLIFITTIYAMLITYFYKLTLYSSNFKQMYYWTAHMRLSEWLVGIMFGAFLADYKRNDFKYRIKFKVLHVLAWLLLFITFALQLLLEIKIRQNPTVLNTMFYYPLQRTIWPLCLCWISYTCLSGYASLLNWFLSLSIFQMLSKICYSTYLVHIVVMAMHINKSRTLPYFSHYELIRTAIADIVVSLAVGTFWALAFEYPGINLEQLVLSKGAKSWKREKPLQDEKGLLIESERIEDFGMKNLKVQ